MKNPNIFCLFALLFGIVYPVHGQTTEVTPVDNINVIPPAPNAASLGKYGDVPVGYYTGIPQITVPLTSLSVEDFELPVELSYYAGGFKVEEQASWVGFGWSLRAGGVITRTVRGLPDELSEVARSGYNIVREEIKKYENGIYTSNQKNHFHDMLAKGLWDGEPDQYYFSFNGKSGTIVFDMNGNPMVNPGQDLKIEGDFDQGFTITDEKGIQYVFSSPEITHQQDGCDLLPVPEFVSSLYLTSIMLPSGESIDFAYNSGITYTEVIPQWTLYQFVAASNPSEGCPGMGGSSCKKVYKTQTLHLSFIKYGKTEIRFNATTPRTDLPLESQEFRLDSVDLVYDNIVSKRFTLSYGAYNCSRLRLDAVRELSGILVKPPYIFEYSSGITPCIGATGQDFWGFYNGKSNSTLVPAGSYTNANGQKVFLAGADRSPTIDAGNGMLKKIIYPTRGSSTFEYEQNSFGYINTVPVQDYLTSTTHIVVEATPDNQIESNTFTLNFEQDVSINYSVNQLDGGTYPSVNEYIMLRRTDDNSVIATRSSGTGTIALTLGTGNYELLAYSENPATQTNASMDYITRLNSYVMTRPGPGIRIASIIDEDGLNSGKKIIRTFRYTMPDELGRSSGVISGLPKFDYFFSNVGETGATCQYYARTSVVSVPGATQGSNIGYRYVTVLRNDSAKSVYSFTSFYDFPDQVAYGYPFPIHVNDDSRRGKPISSIDYKWENNAYTPVRKIINEYELAETIHYGFNSAYKIGYVKKYNMTPSANIYSIQKYYNESRWANIKSTSEVSYNSIDNDSVVNLVNYYYDNTAHLLPTRTETLRSDGVKEITQTIYPLDYAAGTPFIDDMKAKHLVAYPVEQISSIDENSSIQIISGRLNEYMPGGKGFRDAMYVLEIPAAIPLATFKFSSRNAGVYPVGGAASIYQPDTRYVKRIDFEDYNTNGKLRQYKKDNFTISFLWDYDNVYPIAEVQGAVYSDIAYTSFEAEGTGNWEIAGSSRVNTNALTGKKCYELSTGVINKNGLNTAKKYIISFWAKSNTSVFVNNTAVDLTGQPVNGWIYCQKEITGASGITINGNGNIDELRLYPAGSKLSSYTYEPLKGILSQCSEDNKIVYYEYDGLGRLSTMRDYQGKILKVLDYKYQQPVTQ